MQPSGYSFQQHQLVTCMGCRIENLYLHRFSSSAFSSNFAVVVMFSATDVAQMVWDSDSDDGEMEGVLDVEIEENVSRFFCNNYCFHRVAKKVKVGCQSSMSSLRHRLSLSWTMTIRCDSITCVIFTLMLYTVVDIIWMYMTYFDHTLTCMNN